MSFVRLLHTLLLGPRVTGPAGPTPGATGDAQAAGDELRDVLAELYGGRSLRIRAVDAGSTNAEELELLARSGMPLDPLFATDDRAGGRGPRATFSRVSCCASARCRTSAV